MIYLASPYSDPDPSVQAMRFEQVCRVVAAYAKEGELFYSPIAHSHHVAKYGLPGNWEFWKEHDQYMIRACKSFCVLRLAGWEDSKGVTAELRFAKAIGRRISHVTYEELFGVEA